MSRRSLSVFGAAALLAGLSTSGVAQKGHAGAPPMPRSPEAHEVKPAKADHESAMGAAHEGMKGDRDRVGDMKRDEKREDRMEKRADRVSDRAENRAEKATDRRERVAERAEKGAERSENRAEHVALREAHLQSSVLLRGIRLSRTERRQVREIDKKYEAQIRALRKDEKGADRSGKDNDAAFTQRVEALTAQERADIRAVLPAAQQARFDANVAARATVKH